MARLSQAASAVTCGWRGSWKNRWGEGGFDEKDAVCLAAALRSITRAVARFAACRDLRKGQLRRWERGFDLRRWRQLRGGFQRRYVRRARKEEIRGRQSLRGRISGRQIRWERKPHLR